MGLITAAYQTPPAVPAIHTISHQQQPSAGTPPPPAGGKSLEADMLCLLTATLLVSLSLPQPVPRSPSLLRWQSLKQRFLCLSLHWHLL